MNQQRWRLLRIVPLVLLAPAVAAAELPFPPQQDLICANGIVQKDMLVAYLLKKYPLGAAPLFAMAKPTMREALVAALLDRKVAGADKRYSESDLNYLNGITGELSLMLRGYFRGALNPGVEVDPVIYLQGDSAKNGVVCDPSATVAAPKPSPETAPKPAAGFLQGFRIRGDANDLKISRTEAAFKTADRASVAINYDHLDHKRTTRILGFIGYPIRSGKEENGLAIQWIPYMGWRKDSVKNDGIVDTDKLENKTYAGVVGDFRIPSRIAGMQITHGIAVRPDYTRDMVDGSRLATVNLEYTPIKNHTGWLLGLGLNTASDKGRITPLLALRAATGHYTRRSASAADGEQQNFSRVGGRVGLALATADLLELKSTYTGLKNMRGTGSVSYFKHSLTCNLDPKGYVALSLNYTRGRLEDLKEQKQWDLAFTVRY